MTTVITVYDVPAGGEPPAALAKGHTVHRALEAPASFAWIDLGEHRSPEDAAALVAAAAERPGALSGTYEAFHVNELAAPAYDPARDGQSVVFVNCMRFEPEQHDAAFEAWQRVNHYMVAKPGYRWHRLHRRLDPRAPFGLVNVVEWESPEAWRAAHDEGFRRLAGGDLPFTAQPTLCRPVAARAEVSR
jgi:hypothetical protein